ncbi:MAG: 2-dehydro-3-deoxy-D-gluconate 5-dehydrogenase KduD [Chloroflexi bacterium]|nr:2-dehydro-3-deoxy-D-gluconate 5-dehydrogenase KduD [Chloroflexota bacterium]
MLDLFRLNGKVALVTGAKQGLGQGYAIALAEAGADVAALDVGEVNETGERIAALGRRFMPVKCNLRDASVDELNKIVGDIVAHLGRLDILVNNAGIIRRAPALEFSEKDWDDVIHINLRSVFFLSQAAGRVMAKQGGGKIINVASMLSFQGGIIVPSYTAAKSGVAGITKALANEWAKYKINVNAIAPGYMATENTAPIRADAQRSESILARIPAERWGTPEDLHGAVVFLASAASDYMQGAIVPVDGGWLAR